MPRYLSSHTSNFTSVSVFPNKKKTWLVSQQLTRICQSACIRIKESSTNKRWETIGASFSQNETIGLYYILVLLIPCRCPLSSACFVILDKAYVKRNNGLPTFVPAQYRQADGSTSLDWAYFESLRSRLQSILLLVAQIHRVYPSPPRLPAPSRRQPAPLLIAWCFAGRWFAEHSLLLLAGVFSSRHR